VPWPGIAASKNLGPVRRILLTLPGLPILMVLRYVTCLARITRQLLTLAIPPCTWPKLRNDIDPAFFRLPPRVRAEYWFPSRAARPLREVALFLPIRSRSEGVLS
jgi:hypothetical protein